MSRLYSFALKHPRIFAGIWFACFGLILSVACYLPPLLDSSDMEYFCLVILLPTLCVGAAGSLFGYRCPRWSMVPDAMKASLMGIFVLVDGMFLFALVFALFHVLLFVVVLPPGSEPEWPIFVLGTIGSVVMYWWLLVALGALAGWSLYWFVGRKNLDGSAPPDPW